MDLLKTVDQWALVGAVLLLGAYFLWSVKGILQEFKDSVERLGLLIEKLFDKQDNHESRISALEGRCQSLNVSGGRRCYDPNDRP